MDENGLRDFFCPTAAIKMEIERGVWLNEEQLKQSHLFMITLEL